MERIKRKIKIFWTEHGDPIKFYLIFFTIIILSLHGINWIFKQSKKTSRVENISKNDTKIEKVENTKYIELIEEFLQYNKEGKVDMAYNMLSEKCKENEYQTREKYVKEYYEHFYKDRETKVVGISEYEYEVRFYYNNLETGNTSNKEYISQTFEMEEEPVQAKIYIKKK